MPDTLFCRTVTKSSILPQCCLAPAHWMKEQWDDKRDLQEMLWSGLATQQVLEQVWSWLRHVAGSKGITRVLNWALVSNNSEHLAQNLRFHLELNSHAHTQKKSWMGCQGHVLTSVFRSLFPWRQFRVPSPRTAVKCHHSSEICCLLILTDMSDLCVLFLGALDFVSCSPSHMYTAWKYKAITG